LPDASDPFGASVFSIIYYLTSFDTLFSGELVPAAAAVLPNDGAHPPLVKVAAHAEILSASARVLPAHTALDLGEPLAPPEQKWRMEQ